MTSEQRHFTRIPFDTSVALTNTRTGYKTKAELLDISFKGVLISKPAGWQGIDNEHYALNLQLAGNEIEINLDVIAVHSEQDHIGFKTEHMDLETATNLRRLVELNLGNEDLLERELSELTQSN